jgi:hypothetical protein
MESKLKMSSPKKKQAKTIMSTESLLADGTRSVRSVILEQNKVAMELLASVVKKELTPREFRALSQDRMQGQWSLGMSSYNIRPSDVACKHACTYCYVQPMLQRWADKSAPRHRVPDMEDLMPVDPKKVRKGWRLVKDPSKRKMIFFPSTSDIFVENAKDYADVCHRIIDAGHEVLYITKPTVKSITAVCDAIEAFGPKYKKAMTIYITITTNDPELLHKFEPRAPSYAERLECVRMVGARGFDVNVIMEPYLSDPIPMLPELLAALPPTGTIAIGKMNYSPSIKFDENILKDQAMMDYLNELYHTDAHVMSLFREVTGNPRIFLKKDTILAVVKAVERSDTITSAKKEKYVDRILPCCQCSTVFDEDKGDFCEVCHKFFCQFCSQVSGEVRDDVKLWDTYTCQECLDAAKMKATSK